jgi:hypothetical protein
MVALIAAWRASAAAWSGDVAACAMTELDHVVVAAHTLEQGLAHVQAILGIEVPYGGEHARMGTHNRVLRLGEALYLEVIAIDGGAVAPGRPRWFQLDDPALQAELRLAPRLITWVVRTKDIAETVGVCSWELGAIEPMERGELRWLITVPRDGMLVDGGMMPSVIEWREVVHPASRMRDFGCSLERLEAAHPKPAAYRRELGSIGADRHVVISEVAPGEGARLVAHVRTPGGVRTIG